jgi:hypothetical protein
MAPKHHATPLAGGDRKALSKELVKSRAMTGVLAERSEEKRRVGEALIREADNLACQSWNERMWSDLEGRLDCRKCKKAKWKGRGVLEQLAPRRRYDAAETG